MRQRKKALVITFDTTQEALCMEKFCIKNQIPGRLIPVPGEITAGCGLAWKTVPEEERKIEKDMEKQGVKWASMYILKL